MQKNDKIDDNRITPDENIAPMNKAYNEALTPQKLYGIASILACQKMRNPHICTLNYDNVARAYFLERDILLSLSFLHEKARGKCTREVISSIIKIKEKCASQLLSLYITGTGHNLSYSPNIIDRPTYNALYTEINYMQSTLLARLSDICGIYKILSLEHTATLMLHSIRP